MRRRRLIITRNTKCRICFLAVCASLYMYYFIYKGLGMADLPTLYEYYREGEIKAGLETVNGKFQLNKKDITIFSGAIHYFRVHPDYWRDRLRKLRAAGFNTVETYVPWNLHEPEMDVYDFGNETRDMSLFLDVVKYIKIAQEEDLFVLVRPSPYICAEWDFGGMPSWLLRFPGLKVRSSEKQFLERVSKYNSKLFPLFENLQFTKGGPIIGFQIENEYGGVIEDGSPIDLNYLLFLRDDFKKHGLVELLYTSDNPTIHGDRGSVPGVLQTANFQTNPELELTLLKQYQPDKPLMVMEYWSGWFDHWFEEHHTTSVETFKDVLERILKFPSSVNLYMFHGGTNFGFMNGANVADKFPHYQADVTSYDYDAPLSEAGDYTEKYKICQELIAKYNKVLTKLPEQPKEMNRMAYGPATITEQLEYADILERVWSNDRVQSERVVSMENLSVNNFNGQSYGYVVYRTDVQVNKTSSLQIKNNAVYDMAIVLLDGQRKTDVPRQLSQLQGFGFWEKDDAVLEMKSDTDGVKTLDIFVENWGRVNFGIHSTFDQRKGLHEGTEVLVDDEKVQGWEIISLQFKSKWVKSLNDWQPFSNDVMTAPKLVRAVFNVPSVADTYINMSSWGRGVVFINGFNLGRYFTGGPTQALYVPAPLLKQGQNEIIIFELFKCQNEVLFQATPSLG